MAENNTARLLAQRKAQKRGLNFVEKESKFKASIKARWRRPRGKHNPVREGHKGRPGMPHPGYGSPKAVRGLVLDGKVPVVVHTESDLDGLDASKVAVILGGKVGMRKKMALASKAAAMKFSVLNLKDAAAYVKACEETVAARKKGKAAKASAKAAAEKKAKADAKKAEADAKAAATEKKSESTSAKKVSKASGESQ